MDDSLRRSLDHHRPRTTSCRRSCGRSSAVSLLGLLWMLFLALRRGRRRPSADVRPPLRRHRGGAGGGRPRPRHHRRALRAFRPARPLPGRRDHDRSRPPAPGGGGPGRAGRGPPGRRLRATGSRACCAPGSTGTTPGWRPRSSGRRSRSSRSALRGTVSDPRVAVEYSTAHERAGSIRMYETLPLFSGRSTLEGVYNQASLQTHAVYFLASELDATSPNPFRKREYSSFDTESALRHLRLFDVSRGRRAEPAARGEPATRARRRAAIARVPPYYVYDIAGAGGGYVEPLAFAPVRSSWRGWREKSYRWFTRKPLSSALSRVHGRPAIRGHREGRMAGPPGGAAARRGGGAGEGRGRDDHDHHQPRRPSAAGEGLVPPALEGGGRGRPLSRLPGPDDDRAAPGHRAADLRDARSRITWASSSRAGRWWRARPSSPGAGGSAGSRGRGRRPSRRFLSTIARPCPRPLGAGGR